MIQKINNGPSNVSFGMNLKISPTVADHIIGNPKRARHFYMAKKILSKIEPLGEDAFLKLNPNPEFFLQLETGSGKLKKGIDIFIRDAGPEVNGVDSIMDHVEFPMAMLQAVLKA